MKKLIVLLISAASIVVFARSAPEKDYDAELLKLLESDFKSKGIVKVERILQQDDVQKFCSALEDKGASIDDLAKVRESQLKTVKYPVNGVYIGSWESGQNVVSNSKGGQYSDPEGSESGGNCYGCHQMDKQEIAFGTMGPSLYQYGKLRGNSEDIYKYTWAKLYNAQAFIPCSSMPRFGHSGILTELQLKDVMAFLLDPASPVNQ